MQRAHLHVWIGFEPTTPESRTRGVKILFRTSISSSLALLPSCFQNVFELQWVRLTVIACIDSTDCDYSEFLEREWRRNRKFGVVKTTRSLWFQWHTHSHTKHFLSNSYKIEKCVKKESGIDAANRIKSKNITFAYLEVEILVWLKINSVKQSPCHPSS